MLIGAGIVQTGGGEGKIDSDRWRRNWDRAIVAGSLVPALLWGVAFGNIVHGVSLDAKHQFTGTLVTLLNPYALLGGLATLLLFALHGAVSLTLKTTVPAAGTPGPLAGDQRPCHRPANHRKVAGRNPS